jgi:hypothetical protein
MALLDKQTCPTDDELLRLVSGELPPRQIARVEAHVNGCTTCQDHIRAANHALAAFAAHANDDPDLPTWEGFNRALTREEESWRRHRTARARLWSASAAIVATLIAVVVWHQQTEVVLSAETVITRALVSERQLSIHSAAAVRIRTINTSPENGTPSGVRSSAAHTQSELITNRGLAARELAKRLSPYGFDWSAPLSARHFQRWWRDTAAREDRLESLSESLLTVSSTTTDGPIRKAALVVRSDTYQAVGQSWLFADGFEVELTSTPETPDTSRPTRAATALPASEPPIRPAPDDLDSLELDLRVGLRNARARLGPHLVLWRLPNRIHLRGDVPNQAALRHVEALARRHPAVEARVVLREMEPTSDEAAMAGSTVLREWLDQALTDAALRDEFISRATRLRERSRASATDFASLAQRYSPEVASQLSERAQEKLDALARAQLADVATAYEAFERHIAPLVGTVSRPTMPIDLPADWQDRAARVARATEDLSQHVGRVLTTEFETPALLVNTARDELQPALLRLAFAIGAQPGTE